MDHGSFGNDFVDGDFGFEDALQWPEAPPAPEPAQTQFVPTRWSASEQQRLEALLAMYPAGRYSSVAERYIVIAARLPTKTARDVALRVKWMSLRAPPQSQGAPGMMASRVDSGLVGMVPTSQSTLQTSNSLPHASTGDHSGNLARLSSIPCAAPPAPSFYLTQPQHESPVNHHSTSSAPHNSSGADNSNSKSDEAATLPSFCPPQLLGSMMPGSAPSTAAPAVQQPAPSSQACEWHESKAYMESLLQENASLTSSVKVNMEQGKVMENTELLAKCRDNLLALLQHVDTLPGAWRQVPPLPVQINFTMAARLLPPPRLPLPTPGSLNPAPASGGPTMVGPTTTMHHPMLMPSFMGMPGMAPPHGVGGVLSAGMMRPSAVPAAGPGGFPGLPPFPYSMMPPPVVQGSATGPASAPLAGPTALNPVQDTEGDMAGIEGALGGPGPHLGLPCGHASSAAFNTAMAPLAHPVGTGSGQGAMQASPTISYPMSGPL